MTMRKRGEDGDVRGKGRACWWSWQKDGFVGVSYSPGGAGKRTAIEKRARAQGRAREE